MVSGDTKCNVLHLEDGVIGSPASTDRWQIVFSSMHWCMKKQNFNLLH